MLDFNKSAASTECKSVLNVSYIAVGSVSDCISRNREFDSGLARFNIFAEIGHEIISTAPNRIQFSGHYRPASEMQFRRMALCWRADSVQILCAYCDILLLPLIQKGVSVTSESITQSTGYPLCEACPGKKCGYGN